MRRKIEKKGINIKGVGNKRRKQMKRIKEKALK